MKSLAYSGKRTRDDEASNHVHEDKRHKSTQAGSLKSNSPESPLASLPSLSGRSLSDASNSSHSSVSPLNDRSFGSPMNFWDLSLDGGSSSSSNSSNSSHSSPDTSSLSSKNPGNSLSAKAAREKQQRTCRNLITNMLNALPLKFIGSRPTDNIVNGRKQFENIISTSLSYDSPKLKVGEGFDIRHQDGFSEFIKAFCAIINNKLAPTRIYNFLKERDIAKQIKKHIETTPSNKQIIVKVVEGFLQSKLPIFTTSKGVTLKSLGWGMNARPNKKAIEVPGTQQRIDTLFQRLASPVSAIAPAAPNALASIPMPFDSGAINGLRTPLSSSSAPLALSNSSKSNCFASFHKSKPLSAAVGSESFSRSTLNSSSNSRAQSPSAQLTTKASPYALFSVQSPLGGASLQFPMQQAPVRQPLSDISNILNASSLATSALPVLKTAAKPSPQVVKTEFVLASTMLWQQEQMEISK